MVNRRIQRLLLSSLLTPRSLWIAALSSLALWSALTLGAPGRSIYGVNLAAAAVRDISTLLAFAIALLLCLKISGEHHRNRWLRAAWLCLAVCSAVSLVRYFFDTRLVDLAYPGYWSSPWSSILREIPAAVALTFLAAGILTMAAAFYRLGLGFRLRWYDAAAIAGVFVLLALIVVFRNDLSAAHLQNSAVRHAQLFSQVMFSVAAAGSIVLFRIGKQMGGGHLALAMAWIIAHVVVRAGLVLASAIEVHLHLGSPAIGVLHTFLGLGASWMFAFAAASRYQLTRTASEQAAQWGIKASRDPMDAVA
ncbi:MAG: hypothetical protein ACRD9L_12855 [Bryobacteraceae bacterium]